MHWIIDPYGAQHHYGYVTLLSSRAIGGTAGNAGSTAADSEATITKLSKPQQLMSLNAQTPARMGEAVGDGVAGVVGESRSVHRLEKEILEVEVLEQRRIEIRLRKNELELAAACLNQGGPRFWADTNPVQTCWCWLSAVCLDSNREPSLVQGIDRRVVELEQRFATGANDEALVLFVDRPSRGNRRSEVAGGRKLAAVGPDSNKIGITEVADCGCAIRLATRPEVAPAETTKDRRSAGVGTLTLERIENLFDGVHALNLSS